MTKELLETLRNEYRQEMVDVFNNTAELYKEFAERIANGEILTKEDWKQMVNTSMKEILYEDEDDTNTIYLDNLFHEDFDEIE